MDGNLARPKLVRNLLRDEIRVAIQEAIYENQLKPGERVVETRWAKELGVSKAPVREAIRELEAMGLIETRPYQGSFVRHPSAKDIVDASKVRQSLEALGMREAAIRIKDDDLNVLWKILNQMEASAAQSEFEEYIEYDMQFHKLIMKLADNDILYRVWQQSRIAEWTKVVTRMSKQSLDALAARHEAIYKALESRDPDKAEIEAVRHLDELLTEISD